MDFSLSTRWNAHRHSCGRACVEEILDLGFDSVELGYNLTQDLVPGVRDMVAKQEVRIRSIHTYCPVPVGAPYGHPELFTLVNSDPHVRNNAVWHLSQCLRFAADVHAEIMVVHGGYADMRALTPKLIALAEKGQRHTKKYEKTLQKLFLKRQKRANQHMTWLQSGLEKLIPICEETGVSIGLENLPNWEAVPSEEEMERLSALMNNNKIRYWHDFGHGQIRQNLGFISHKRWLEKLTPYLGGVHIHDVIPPSRDHVMPPDGDIDFKSFRTIGESDIVRVFEPSSRCTPEEVARGLATVKAAWQSSG
jgi:sugar phosphate isomerase/epimerase